MTASKACSWSELTQKQEFSLEQSKWRYSGKYASYLSVPALNLCVVCLHQILNIQCNSITPYLLSSCTPYLPILNSLKFASCVAWFSCSPPSWWSISLCGTAMHFLCSNISLNTSQKESECHLYVRLMFFCHLLQFFSIFFNFLWHLTCHHVSVLDVGQYGSGIAAAKKICISVLWNWIGFVQNNHKSFEIRWQFRISKILQIVPFRSKIQWWSNNKYRHARVQMK